MLELHGQRIVEQVAPPGRLEQRRSRRMNKGAVDVGPGAELPAAQAATSAPK
jgi:hypothetical protein